MQDLDKADRRILDILQADNRLTNLELAERAHLSPPTCLRRVRRLRERGVIVADVSIVDPAQVGMALFVFVGVALEHQSEALQRDFEGRMEKAPEVTQCYMVSGDTDYMLVVQVRDMAAYHAFVRRELTNAPNVRNFRSHFAMNRSKFQTRIDLTSGSGD